jgi:hypothetical protein
VESPAIVLIAKADIVEVDRAGRENRMPRPSRDKCRGTAVVGSAFAGRK